MSSHPLHRRQLQGGLLWVFFVLDRKESSYATCVPVMTDREMEEPIYYSGAEDVWVWVLG